MAESLDPHASVGPDRVSLAPERILINRDQPAVEQDVPLGQGHAAHVTVRDQRRRHHRPHGEVRAHLLQSRNFARATQERRDECHEAWRTHRARIPNLLDVNDQFVGIVPVTGAGPAGESGVDRDRVGDTQIPVVEAAGVPERSEVPADANEICDPQPVVRRADGHVEAVGVDAVDDWPPRSPQRIAHLGERHDLIVERARPGAVVVLHIVDSPRRERSRVLALMVEAACRPLVKAVDLRASLSTRRLVDA